MGKKLKFPFKFKSTEKTTISAAASPPPWLWPACVDSPKTLSFRCDSNANIYDSAYIDHGKSSTDLCETPDSCFSIRNSFEQGDEIAGGTKNEERAVIGGMKSDRLIFEPGETSSILEEAKAHDLPHEESVRIMAMDSSDPLMDFRASMEEMVEAYGLDDWECLEELLTCYLRLNDKSKHGYIVGAFVDVLINLALASDSSNDCSTSAIDEHCSSSSTATQCSFTSPLSSSSSSSTYSSTSQCLSSLGNEDEK